jgi:tetratricopeptide (TPR) repeat protein
MQGDYNCLSAAVVYADLCREVGIELEFCLQPGHIYVRSAPGGERQAAPRIEAASKRWQARLAEEGDPSAARRLSAAELLAKFYYNRGLVRLAAHDYPAGLALLEISQAFDPVDSDARHNLVAGLNNWAVQCCGQRQYEEAARLIKQGLLIEPSYPPLQINERMIGRVLGE